MVESAPRVQFIRKKIFEQQNCIFFDEEIVKEGRYIMSNVIESQITKQLRNANTIY